ncbi:MBL fold metallo-hydrolase [Actinophytocola sp.]|uniref:MBL fold metallo-hydrolase n=1 Tax=Actinophytocola sp. TaxID=1872138 RepID=UPI002D7F8248|nr:MBL fold metallo-hydrolase [Actinophytocola sp.]HET9140646.1 MBL fold metallo-hydrolase [Actinophytocola sp.]
MRVHHLNCGSMRPRFGGLVDGQPGVWRAGQMVCHCLLIETEAGLVLVDSGLGLHDLAEPRARLGRRFLSLTHPLLAEAETAVRQVAALGFDPADVRHVVLTHLDLDHAGGIADFPTAKVHVYGAEHRAAMNPATRLEKTRYRTVQWSHGPEWVTYGEDGESWFGFASVRALSGLPEEILLVPLAGHTRGHAAVAVDTGEKWLLHAGDGYFFRGEVDPVDTRSTPVLKLFQNLVEHDHRTRVGNQRRLRELVAAHRAEVEVFSAHDAVEIRRYGPTWTERPNRPTA